MHAHHDKMIEPTWENGFVERETYIGKFKPAHEIPIRLEVFKELPDVAILDLPQAMQRADAEWSTDARSAFHAKWCGCTYWNGEELVFPKP